MKKQNLTWRIQDLVDERKSINPKPQYQRTEVWTLSRKQKLVDSIIKGFDLPKFYLRRFEDHPSGYIFEVTDGQQRMRAIWDFVDNIYKLGETKIGDVKLNGLTFSELSQEIRDIILNFELSFSEIYDATEPEINELFARLQQGVILNPAELRNAIPSILGAELKKLLSNPFFASSKIVDKRFKHQEYLDHAAALFFYQNNKDLKAKAMSELYVQLSEEDAVDEVKELVAKLKASLDILNKVNAQIPGYFRNKWAFVDVMNFISKKIEKGEKINVKNLSASFKKFEDDRKNHTSKPQILLDKDGGSFDPELYKYINAFNKDGAIKTNIDRRLQVLDAKLLL
ncbi:DUF262 domain-containing protein [Nubsella zeaxanthinifaciens]|uniref:DUF262 domain-containing protein n=1 Tax=Nubsella zeaxanthinifaciens TaxID=392412 RepID=UPI000DE4DAFA|nr:DUF262 domain-containing protein [Nubsella zeaxanthinifaciens]